MSKNKSNRSQQGRRVSRFVPSALSLALLSASVPASNLPTGEQVRHGNATFDRNGASLVIDQLTGKLIVNWDDFSIGAGNQVVFLQDRSDIALNRVVGDNPSLIFGNLKAGGQVFLVNQSGILFSPTARVDVGGLVASSLAISDTDFLAGNYTFSGAGGSVVNQGELNAADGGYIALLGQHAINEGVITARLGTVALGAGDRMSIDLVGDGLVKLHVDKAKVDALVANRGIIIADGGRVLMTASALNELAATVVNNEGVIEANTVDSREGRVFLVAEGGDIEHSGSIDVSATGSDNGGRVRLDSDRATLVGGDIDAISGADGGTGGSVRVLGNQVGLLGTAAIDASGRDGGGEILVGGDFQGSNDNIRNAQRTVVLSGAELRADATGNGDGGKVIVWADDSTRYYGSISATGGAAGGNGGFAEVSGKQGLTFQGDVDLTAAQGDTGTLLLDPSILYIYSNGPAGAYDDDLAAAPVGTIDFALADEGNNRLQVSQIESISALADIFLNAGQINFENQAGPAGNIDLAAGSSITFSTDSTAAGGGDGSISNTGGNAFAINTSGAGAITFDAEGLINLAGISLNSADAVSLTSGSTVSLGNVNAGSLGITAAGNIGHSSGLNSVVVSGQTTLTADTNAITATLDNATNNFNSVVLATTNGGSFSTASVRDSNALTIGGDATTLFARAGGALGFSGGDYTTLNGQASTSITQSGGLNVSGTTTLTADSAAMTADLATQTNDFGTVTLVNGGGTFGDVNVADSNGLTLGGNAADLAVLFGGDLTLAGGTYGVLFGATGGNVLQSGAVTVTGATTFASTGTDLDITLDDATNNFNTFSLLTVGGTFDTVTVDDANALAIGGSATTLDATAGTALTLAGGTYTDLTGTANGGNITQTGALDVSGTADLTASGDITLATATNDFGGAVLLDAVNADIVSANDLDFGAGTLTGDLAAQSVNGAITQSGALDVDGAAGFTADTDITLDNAGNLFTGTVTLGGVNAAVVDADGDLDLGASTLTGDLTAESVNGAITQSGALDVDGASDFTASTDITLTDVTNTFGGTVTLDGVNATVVDADGDLDLGASTLTGDLTAESLNGAITQSGALDVDGAADLTANTDITLTDVTNTFGGTVTLSGVNADIADADGDLDLGASTLTGDLTAESVNGAITQSGTLDVDGAADLTAATDITLNDVANTFGGAVALDGVNATVVDADGDLDLGASTLTGDLTAQSLNGAITQSGALDVDGAADFTANTDITLTDVTNTFGGTVTLDGVNATVVDADGDLDLGASALTGDLTAESTTGAITQSGTLDVDGASDFTASTDITLTDVTNTFGGTVTLDGVNATVVDADGDLDLGASTLTGDLTAESVNGAITQSGALDVTGAADFTAANDITLTDAGNDFGGAVLLDGVSANIVSANDLEFGTTTLTGDLFGEATAGAITQSGVIDVTLDADFTAGTDITLDNTGNQFGGIVHLDAVNADVVDANGNLSLGTVALTGNFIAESTAGAIVQGSAIDVDGTADFTALNDITLDQANTFGGTVTLDGVNATVVDADGDLDLGASTLTGDLTAESANGAITQSGALDVDGAADFTASTDITLNDVTNTFGGTVTLDGVNATVVDADGDLDLGASTLTGDLTAESVNGAITQSGALDVDGASDFTAAGDITLTNPGNLFAGTVTLDGVNASLLDTDAGLDLGASTLTGNLTAESAGGGITQSGALDVDGTAHFLGGQITLTNTGNLFGGAVRFSGLSNADIVDADGDLDLGASTLTGDLTAESVNGAITQSGTLDVDGAADLTASTDITLNDVANTFGGTVSLDGATADVVDADGDLDLGTSTLTGDLTAESVNGAITDSGLMDVGGTADFTAATGITLDTLTTQDIVAGTTAGNIDITNDSATPVTVTSLSTTGGDITFAQTGTGTVTFTTVSTDGAGIIDLSAEEGLAVDGTVSTAGGNITINADSDAAGNGLFDLMATGALNTAGGDLSITAADFDFAAGGSISTGGGAFDLIASQAGDMCLGTAVGGCQVTLDNTDLSVLTNTVSDLTLDNGTSAIRAQLANFNGIDLSLSGGTIDSDSAVDTALVDVGNLTLTSTGAIGTANGGLSLEADTVDVTSTGGNAVTLVGRTAATSYVIGSAAPTGAVDITQEAGDLTVTGVDSTGSVTLDAQAASLVINGNIDAGDVVDLSGATGISLGANVTTTDDNITFNDAVTLTTNVQVDSGAGAGDITFAGDIGGSFGLTVDAGTGTVDLANVSVDGFDASGGQIDLNGSTYTAQNGNILLDGLVTLYSNATLDSSAANGNTEITGDTDGAFNLVIDAGTGTVDLANVSVNDIDVAGAQIDLNGANYTALNGNILLTGPVTLYSDTTLDSSAANGNTEINGVTDGAFDLVIDAGTGTVDLGNVSVNDIDVTGGQIDLNGANYTALNGNILLDGLVTLYSNATLDSSAANGNTEITGDTDGAFNLVIDAGTGTVDLANVSVNDIDVTGGQIDLNGANYTALAGNILLDGLVTLYSNATLDSSAANGNTEITGDTDGAFNLVIDAGTGTVDLANVSVNDIDVTGGQIDLNGANYTALNGNILLAGPVTLYSDTTLDSSAANGDVEITGATDGAFNLVIDAGTGTVDLANVSVNDIDVTGGQIDLNGSSYTALNGDILLTGPVMLYSNATLDSSAADGDITFADTLDGAFDLTLDSGGGDIGFDGIVGGINPLDDVSITSAGNVDIGAAFNAASFEQLAGTGTTTIDGALTAATGDIVISTTDIDQNAAITATAGNVSLTASQGITLDAGAITAGDHLIHLSAGTSAVQAAATHGGLLASDLLLGGTGDFTLVTTTNDNLIGTIATDGAVGGTIRFENDQSLTVGTVTDLGAVAHNGVTAGRVVLNVDTGNLTVNQAVEATTDHVGLHAQSGSLAVNAAVTAVDRLTLVGSTVTQAAAGDLDTGGDLVVVATGGDLTMADGAQSTTTSDVLYRALAGNILLGQLDGDVVVVDASGNVVDNGVTEPNVTANTLLISAGGNIGAPVGTGNGPLEIDAGTVAADAGGVVYLSEANSVTVGTGTVGGFSIIWTDGTLGSTAGATETGLTGTAVVLQAGNDITVDNAVSATATDVLLDAQGGDLAINATVDATRHATLRASDNVTQAAAGDVTTGGTLYVEATGGDITMTDGATSLATANLVYSAGGDVTVGTLSGANLAVFAGGDILDGGDANVDLISVDGLQLTAGGSIGQPNGTGNGALETTVSAVAMTAADSIYLAETNGLLIQNVPAVAYNVVNADGTVSLQAGAALADATAGDSIKATAGGGITVNIPVAATTGDILLQSITNDVGLNNTVTAGGNVSILAALSVFQSAAGDINAGGTLDVDAGSADIMMADGALSTATGNIRYDAAGNIVLGGLSGANVMVVANGNITDGGDADADVTGTTVQLVAGANVGQPDGTGNGALDIDADTLAASAGTGSVYVSDSDALVIGSVAAINVQRVDTDATPSTINGLPLSGIVAAQNVMAEAAGDLTVSNSVTATNADVLLHATAGDLAVNAAVTAGDDATLRASGAITQDANGDVTTGGTLDVHAAGGAITMDAGAVSTATGNARYLATGAITVGDITAANARIEAGGAIIDADANGDSDLDVTATTVQLVAGGDIGSGANAIETSVDTLASTSGGSSFISEANDLIVGSVAAIDVERVNMDAVNTNEAGVLLAGILAAQSTRVQAAGNLTVDNAVTATAADVLLHATAGDLAVNAAVTAGDDATLRASGAITQSANGDVITGGTLDVHAAGGAITMDADAVSTATGNARYLATGDITIGDISALNARIEAGGAIIDADANGDTDTDVSATTLQLVAGGDIGSGANAIETDVGTLASTSGGSSFVSEANALVIGSVAVIDVERVNMDAVNTNEAGVLLAGILADQSARVEAAGNLTVSNSVTATNADVLLHATAGDLAVNAAVTAGDDATLRASGAITQDANGDVTTGGTLDVHAAGGAITMDAGAVSTATGNARYLATGAITVGDISAANARIEAGGAIIDADGAGDSDLDVTAATVQLVAGGDIGSGANAIETDVGTLASTSGGSSFISEANALVIGSVAAIDVERVNMDAVNTNEAGAPLAGILAAQSTRVQAAGNLTVDNAVTATAADVLLHATAGDLAVNAAVIAGDDATLRASGAVTQSATGDVTTGGTLDVQAEGGAITMDADAVSTATGNARYLATGAITIGDISAANARIEAGGDIMDADANGDIDTDVSATTLQLVAGGDIGSGANAIETDVGTLASTSGGSSFVSEANALVIGSVAAIDVERVNMDGVNTNEAGVLLAGILAAQSARVEAAGNLTVDNAVTATAADVLLHATAGDLAVNAAVTAGDDATLLASGGITQSAAGDIITGGTLDVEAEGGDITMAANASSTATGNARYLATGNITVGDIDAANVRIDAGGAIIDADGAGDSDTDVTGDTVQLQAGGDIGTAANAIETDIATLLAADSTTGGIWVDEASFLEIGTVDPIDLERVNIDDTSSPLAGVTLVGVHAAGDIEITADDMDISEEVVSTGGDIFLQARDGSVEQLVPAGQVVADAGDIEVRADDGSIWLQLVSALGNQVTLTASERIFNNNGADTNVIADVLVASAADYIGDTAGYFTDPDVDQRITTEVQDSITVSLSESGTVAIDNRSADGSVDVIFDLQDPDVDNGSSVWVRNNEAMRALGLRFATQRGGVDFNGDLQLLAEHGDLTLNEDTSPDGDPVSLVADWMRLSAARGAFLNGDGSRFMAANDGLSLTADDLVLITGGDFGARITADRLNVIGTGLYQVAPGGAPGDGGEAANLDLVLRKRDLASVDEPIRFETIVIDRQGEAAPDWIADLDTFFPYGWVENTYGLFTTGTAQVVSQRQTGGGGVTHDGSIRFADHVQAGALSAPADLTLAVRAGRYTGNRYAGTVYVDSGVTVLAENIGTTDTGSATVYGNVLVDGQVIAREDRSIELQGRSGNIVIDSDTSAAGRVLLAPGLGYDVIFTNAATFTVTQSKTADGDLVILSARNVVMEQGTGIVADGSVLIGADNITGDVVLASGNNAVEGDVILYNVKADANRNGTGDVVVYTTGDRAGEKYTFDYGNGVQTYRISGNIVLGRQDVVDSLVAALDADPRFLNNRANIPPAAIEAENVVLIAADSILSGWAIDYASGDLQPGQEPVHVIAREDMTMDARGGVVGGTPDLNGRNSALEATFQPLRVEVGDTMSIGAAEYDTYGVSARLVGSAQFLQEIGYVPGLINFNEWNVGGALDEKFVSGTTIDMTHFQALGQDTLGRNRGEALIASLYPTHNAMSDVTYALGQPQPVPAVWAVGESTDTGNEFLEKPVEPETPPAPQEDDVNVIDAEGPEIMLPVPKDKHEVRNGDTLWEISREHFGDPNRWPEIWRRTPDIRDPNLIYPGQEIRLKPEAEEVPL